MSLSFRTQRLLLSPWKVLLRTGFICGALAVLLFSFSLKKVEHLPITNGPLKFDGALAQSKMWDLAKNFPGRVTWSPIREKAGHWIKTQFKEMGYEPQSIFFSETIAGKQYINLENIYAQKLGTQFPQDIVIIAAHYDVTDTTHEGAMDDASGVGVVLELARVFSKEQPKRTFLFLTTDSEEFGAFWGAKEFIKNFSRTHQIVAVANFDFVAPEKQAAILMLCDGLKIGYTPMWLREMALDSLKATGGFQVIDMTNVLEHIQRALQIPAADHGAFLASGIPAFNWAGQTKNFAYQMAHYHHTKHDVAEILQPESFSQFGLSAERFLRSLDALHQIPPNFRDFSYWKVSSGFYLDGWVVTILHILSFLPFLTYSLSKFRLTMRNYRREHILKALTNEAKAMSILLGSLLVGYAIMLMLPLLRIITQYETFPATQKSLILNHPNFLAILLVLLSIVLVYYVLTHMFKDSEDSLELSEVRHAFHAGALALVIFLAFLKNSYLGTLLLLPPAYFWTAMKARKRARPRLLNALLLIGGSVTFIATIAVMATLFHIGVVYWYLFLAATYGLISAYAVILFLAALTVMIRLFRALILK